ncbi:MAG: hypothetical protein U0166_09070 [Acidobacteriota bacterium]
MLHRRVDARVISAVLFCVIALPAAAQVPQSSGDSLKPNHAPHRRTIIGTVKAVDTERGIIVLDVGIGKTAATTYDKDTKIKGELAVGKKVKIKTSMSSMSVRAATSIKVKD